MDLVAVGINNAVEIYELMPGRKLVRILSGHASSVTDAVYSPEERRMVTGGHDTTVRCRDSRTGRETLTLSHLGSVASVAFSSDGKRIASGGRLEKTLKVWEAASLAQRRE